MIIEYHRPKSIQDALDLLTRPGIHTIPMGGGVAINQPSTDPVAVVDLQDLALSQASRSGNLLEIGATVTLQSLLELVELPALRTAILQEATVNLRQAATLAGSLVAAKGRSPLALAFLALDALLTLLPGDEKVSYGDLLPFRPENLQGKFITKTSIPNNVRFAYEAVARSPADQPVIMVAVAMWPSRRTRLAVGGWGLLPVLAMDGPEPGGAANAAENACQASHDEWASAEYRCAVAPILTRRCLHSLGVAELGGGAG